MIYASLNAKKGNYQYPAAIATALEFLAKPETAELPVGRYELDGDNIFVSGIFFLGDSAHIAVRFNCENSAYIRAKFFRKYPCARAYIGGNGAFRNKIMLL